MSQNQHLFKNDVFTDYIPYKKEYFSLSYTLGFVTDKVPSNLSAEVETKCNKLLEDTSLHQPYNERLVGHINEEYQLPLSENFQKYLFELFKFYCEEAGDKEYSRIIGMCSSPPQFNFALDNWVNFQSKYEYNPPHYHTGLFSWVLWHKIPFTNENEKRYGPGYKKHPDHKNYNGNFIFQFADGFNICDHDFPVDNKWEGSIVLFPSALTHQVFPFYTSDDYRITVAGNIKFK